MQIWIFSKHHTFKYDFWEKTRYANMNFLGLLFTPDITATVNLLSVITMMMDGVRSLKVILFLEVVLGNEGHSCAD